MLTGEQVNPSSYISTGSTPCFKFPELLQTPVRAELNSSRPTLQFRLGKTPLAERDEKEDLAAQPLALGTREQPAR